MVGILSSEVDHIPMTSQALDEVGTTVGESPYIAVVHLTVVLDTI